MADPDGDYTFTVHAQWQISQNKPEKGNTKGKWMPVHAEQGIFTIYNFNVSLKKKKNLCFTLNTVKTYHKDVTATLYYSKATHV